MRRVCLVVVALLLLMLCSHAFAQTGRSLIFDISTLPTDLSITRDTTIEVGGALDYFGPPRRIFLLCRGQLRGQGEFERHWAFSWSPAREVGSYLTLSIWQGSLGAGGTILARCNVHILDAPPIVFRSPKSGQEVSGPTDIAIEAAKTG